MEALWNGVRVVAGTGRGVREGVWGRWWVVEGERGIAGIGWAEGEAGAVRAAWVRPVGEALDSLWDNPEAGFFFPLELAGTPFQWRVWEALRGIPRGKTVTYGALAAQLGRPGSARAVAGAVAANRHAIVIPCHRVIPAAGGAGGYRWGGERKRALLEHEQAIAEARARR
jgi:AraC family transcriptional regulator of adaptative response/methylated-DNA-[protein]-cysteine methyltransferase